MASFLISLFLIFNIYPLLTFGANNGSNLELSSIQCPPPPPCICICNPSPPNTQTPWSSPPIKQPLPPPPITPQSPPAIKPITTPLSPSPNAQPSPPSITPHPPPPPPIYGGICLKNAIELQICANILATADAFLGATRADPCCSIVRNLSDVDAVTCLCKSVGARPFSLSPNFNIFFRVCGRRIPQGFSCPGPSPIMFPPPPNILPPPPIQTTAPPPRVTTPPPPPPITPSPPPSSGGICLKNATELQICANILATADAFLGAARANPCCSIVRNLSDVDAVTCLCKSVGARPFSLSPNFNIFFRVCGRRIPQGFSCPGPSPIMFLPPPNILPPPPIQTISPPPPVTTPPPRAPITPSPPPPPPITPSPPPPFGGICLKNATELQICANILATADASLGAARANPCCSIVRSLSDVDAVTCLCKSVGARPFSLSPNFNIFFKVCGRRIPQGFSCP